MSPNSAPANKKSTADKLSALLIEAGYIVDTKDVALEPYELPKGALISHLRISAPIRKKELMAHRSKLLKTKKYKKLLKKNPSAVIPMPAYRVMAILWFNDNPARLQGVHVFELFGTAETNESMFKLAHSLHTSLSEEVRMLIRVAAQEEVYE
jgi:hypothetical protein